MNKSKLIKLYIVLILVFVFLCAWAYDLIRVKSYKIDLVYISNTQPIASTDDPVDFTLRVTRNGVPCSNFEIECRSPKGGTFHTQLLRTDSDGYVNYRYYPYNEKFYKPADEVEIVVLGLSNSVFIEVNVTTSFSLYLQPASK